MISDKISIEARAALAARVCAEAVRRGYRPEDEMNDTVMIHPDRDASVSSPVNMRSSINRDPNMVAFVNKNGYLRIWGYGLSVGTSVIGLVDNKLRVAFKDRKDLNLAIDLGLPCSPGFQEQFYTRGDEADLSLVLPTADGTGGILTILGDSFTARMSVNTGTGILRIVPTVHGYKKCMEVDRLVPIM